MPGKAAWVFGNELHTQCGKAPPPFAYGYIFGLIDVYDQKQGYFCLPSSVKGEQLFDVVCRYIDAHPDERHLPASVLAYRALRLAWPCSQ
ncbi:Rap1a/Tai family immunity protein [Mesorhizobium sp.]|uniref:Rap1a/Tai family immunity protein n=1 Tax=Mesorhizobium sp. TaxID=1871066 RepID=UPI003450E843